MTTPTIGRVVYYRPSALDLQDPSITMIGLDQPFRADVCSVSADGLTVNLSVADHIGRVFPRTDVLFFEQQQQTGEAHAHWMPYQLAQAAAGQPATPPVV